MYMFNNLIQKKNKCYVSLCDENIKLFFNEIKIKKIQKISNSSNYIITCYINNNINKDDIVILKNIDIDAYNAIINNNDSWFNNKLDINEIDKLYSKSYTIDNNTIDIILSTDVFINIFINNKNIDDNNKLIELLFNYNELKKYIINIEIDFLGLYFYPKSASNKWIIKSININNIEECEWNKNEIEDEWYNDLQEFNNDIDDEIIRLNELKNKANKVFNEIKNIKMADNLWENKINILKSIIFNKKY